MENREDVRGTIAALQAQMAALIAKLDGDQGAEPAAAPPPAPQSKRTLAVRKRVWPREKPIEVEVTTSPTDRIKLALMDKCLHIKELAEVTGLSQAQVKRDVDKLIEEKQVIDASSGEMPLLTWNGGKGDVGDRRSGQKERAHTLVRLLRVRWIRRRELLEMTGWAERELDNAITEVRRLKGPPYCWKSAPSDYKHSPQYWVSDMKPPKEMDGNMLQPRKHKQ